MLAQLQEIVQRVNAAANLPDALQIYRGGKLAIAARVEDVLPAGPRPLTVSQPHLLEAIVATELDDGRRVVYRGEHVAAFVPVFARYSYEVWIATRRAAPSIAAFTDAERADFVRALKTVLLKYDGLWSKAFPYIMSLHQAPTDGRPHPEAHFHVEFYPAYRMPGRLKYLAGSEMGAGVFTADTLPEDKAKELQAVEVTLT